MLVAAAISCALACRDAKAPSPTSHEAAATRNQSRATQMGGHHDHSAHEHAQHAPAAAPPLATESLYHTQVQLTDQDGRPFELRSLRGSAVLATMFYASCTSVCPMLIAQLERIVAALPSDTRAKTHVLLVSLDPERDDTAQLKQLAERHKLTDPHWHFVRTDSGGAREVAALLGVRYRHLPDGEISHSQLIALLDQSGVIQERMENAAGDPASLIAATVRAAQTDALHAAQ